MKSYKEWSRKTTITILVVIVVLLIVWDVWVYIEPTEGDTISEVTLGLSNHSKAFVYALGVLSGHLLWPQRVKVKS